MRKIFEIIKYIKNYLLSFKNNFYIYSLRNFFRKDSNAITIKLSGGLSNRLCTLISTKIACEPKNKKLNVVWRNNRYCGCEFKDLFSNNDINIIENTDKFNFDDWNRFDSYLTTKHKTMFYSDLNFCYFNNVLTDSDRAEFDLGVPKNIKEKFTHELNNLKIIDDIRDKLIKIPQNIIGIHIRKSDFLNKRKKLNYDWFEQKMVEEMEKDSTVLFFLATDCNETKSKMIEIFGNKILYYPFKFSVDEKNFLKQRSDKEGMQSALLDLITLSKTKKIIGTYGSSYSWLAGMWGNISVEFNR